MLDELSAYIDGESRNAPAIARHLQSCPECARRHVELSKLTRHVHALPAPEVLPSFAARVVARLDQADAPARWHDRFLVQHALPTAWALAAVLLIVGTAYVVIQEVESRSDLPSVAESSPAPVEPDPEVLARILDMGIWEGPFGEDEAEVAGESVDLSVELLIDSLAAIAGDAETGEWYEEEDLMAVMEALAQEDVQVLSELARNHWDEG